MLLKDPNIAVFSLSFAPFEGGAEIAVREVIKRQKGLNFTIFTNRFNKAWPAFEALANMEIFRLGRGRAGSQYYGRIWDKIFYIFLAWKKAEELHKRKRFELIWMVMASYGGIAALIFKLRHPRIPLLLTIQEGDSEKHMTFGKFGLVGLLSGQIIKKSDYIQVISNFLKSFMQKRGAHCPIEVVPNGVDLELFNTSYKNFEIKAARENLGIRDDYMIITASRLVYKNGVDILIEAVAKFKEKRSNVKCLIIGGGPELKKLKAQSQKLKVENNVIFLGQIPQKDLPLYFRLADVFVRASRSEGLGNAFLEAMATCIPVIGTPVGGIVDFLHDGQTGFFVKVDEPVILAEKIKYILDNPNIAKQVVDNAYLMVQQNYSWDIVAKLFRNIFDRLINL